MLAPETIQDALVAKLRAIPELVALFSSSAQISSYIDEWPGKIDVLEAVRALEEGSMLVAFQETGTGRLDRMETWKHRLSIYLKPKGKMSDAWYWFVNGVPTGGDGLKMLYTKIHPGILRMNPPGIRRQFLTIDAANGVVIDYFEISVVLDEKEF